MTDATPTPPSETPAPSAPSAPSATAESGFARHVRRNVMWLAVSALLLGFLGFLREKPTPYLLGFQIGAVAAAAVGLGCLSGRFAALAAAAALGAVGGLALAVIAFLPVAPGSADDRWPLLAMGVWWVYWSVRDARVMWEWVKEG